MRLEVFDSETAAELAAFLREQGFVVVRRGLLLDVHLQNHVSARYDRLAVQAVLRSRLADKGCAVVVEPALRVERIAA
jgi:hypothetical protein